MAKLLLIIFAIIIVFILYIFIEPYLIETVTYNFSEKSAANNVRIVFITDIHHGPFFSITRVNDLVKKINELTPDIVLLGGDYVHRDKKYIEPVFKALSEIQANTLIAGVLGNHDHWESKELTISKMIEANILYLDNTSIKVNIKGKDILIAGVGDLREDYQDIKSIESNEEECFTILLSHNPDYVENTSLAALNKINLVLSGHTHGGQVTLFGLWAPLIPSKYRQKYRTGLKYKGNTRIIISNGIGTITPPVRFFARPQVIVINI